MNKEGEKQDLLLVVKQTHYEHHFLAHYIDI